MDIHTANNTSMDAELILYIKSPRNVKEFDFWPCFRYCGWEGKSTKATPTHRHRANP